MDNIIKLIHDIFSMKFDVIIPVSGSIIAIMAGFLLFAVRYFTFRHNRKKYEKRQKGSHTDTPAAEQEQSEGNIPDVKTNECDAQLFDETSDNKEVKSL